MERPCSGAATLFACNDLRDFIAQNWKPRFDDAPDQFVIHIGVTMDKDVSERDDFLIVRNAFSQR